ncbi:MAG TPA: hypothetical protein VF530_15320 [Planctomycetota bacterium]
MARRKNLLEAFQRSSPSAAGSASASGEPAAPAPLFDAPPSAPRGPGYAFGWPLALVAVVLAFALGYALGRGQGREARAEEPPPALVAPSNQPRAFQERVPAAGAEAPAAAGPAAPARIQDSALFDPANLYTVIVASYTKGKNNANQDLAWATYQHLLEAGVTVFPPVESGNLLVVLAGAAPRKQDLEATEARVRALVRDGEKPYFDAYRVQIDKLIPRTKPAD